MRNSLVNLRIFVKKHYLFLIVLFFSVLLRAYRLDRLTTFGGDQGMDFLQVRDMVLYHKWTLIGLKTSIAPFFQGPLYLYMLLPFFVILDLHPIAGAVAAIFVSTATIILLYVTLRRYISSEIAILASSLYAVSPEFIIYGNTPLYQNFLPLFIVLSIYLFLSNKKRLLVTLLLGFSIGLGMELHFLNVSLGLALFIFFILFARSRLAAYVGGVIYGLIPTILFEVRHNFLNTQLFFSYRGASQPAVSFAKILQQWTTGSAMFLGGNTQVLGLAILIFMVLFLFYKKQLSPPLAKLRGLTIVSIVVILALSLVFSAFGPEYILPVWTLFLILIPIALIQVFPGKVGRILVSALIVFNLYASVLRYNENHGYNMPEGWTMQKINKAGEIISQDSQAHPNFNVASLIEGGTRAYPLRYSTYITGGKPEPVENYPMNNFLYVVSDGDKESLYEAKVWEVSSFSPFTVGATWDLGENVYLYRLDRIRS